MAKGVIRKRCVECRKVQAGRANKYERCMLCGAETVALRYANTPKRRSRARRD